jgi:hypothetical protein
LALLVLMVLSSDSVAGAAHRPSSAVDILVYNYANVPTAVLSAAQREASKILGTSTVELDWVECAPASTTNQKCLHGWTKQSPGLRLITGFNRYQETEFGHADIPVLATIYYEKVARRVHAENADPELGMFLGALMAHELGHIFLGDPEHSTFGVMEPSWGRRQIRSALGGNLFFTAQQTAKIKRRLELRDNRRQDSVSTTLNFEMECCVTNTPNEHPRVNAVELKEIQSERSPKRNANGDFRDAPWRDRRAMAVACRMVISNFQRTANRRTSQADCTAD